MVLFVRVFKSRPSTGRRPRQPTMMVQIFPRPRRCKGQRPVVVTREVLEGYFKIPLFRAAKELGVSETALKSACRKVGIDRWPCKTRTRKHLMWTASEVVDVQCDARCDANCDAECEVLCNADCDAECDAECDTACDAGWHFTADDL